MKRKTGFITIFLFSVITVALVFLDITGEDRLFSSYENRILAARPTFTPESLFAGTYAKDYETYVTDQFVGRDSWIGVKTYSEKLLGKKDINGVYLGQDGYLMEKHEKASIDSQKAGQKLKQLSEDLKEYQALLQGGEAKAMLVPTAGEILKDKLPAFAEDFNQKEYSEQAEAELIPVQDALEAHREEEIYYKSDHHWTTLGAWYAYEAWASDMGIEALPLSAYTREVKTEEFLGTLHSKVNLPMKADMIEVFVPKAEKSYQVYYDLAKEAKTTLYEEKYLDTKNKYGLFLDDNHAIIQIDTEPSGSGKSILVIKDSYANCFIPFLTEHYDTVYVVDKRYYRRDVRELLAEKQVNDLLVLYDVIHFIDNY